MLDLKVKKNSSDVYSWSAHEFTCCDCFQGKGASYESIHSPAFFLVVLIAHACGSKDAKKGISVIDSENHFEFGACHSGFRDKC